MPNIKPVSDLRNYSDVLHDVTAGAPVFFDKEWARQIRYFRYAGLRKNAGDAAADE